MAPEARSKFGAPCSKLRSFGRKFTSLKKVLVTLLGLYGAFRSHLAPSTVIQRPGNCVPLAPLSSCPWPHPTICSWDKVGRLKITRTL